MVIDTTDKVMQGMVLLLLVLWAGRPPFDQVDESLPHIATPQTEGCTIGVVSARATTDGRPLLWKIRDNSDLPNNSISFDSSYPHRFIAVTNSGEAEVWMGVNEKGFAIINSTSHDLAGGSTGLNNGLLMRHALGTCARVRQFMFLLDSTNVTGRRTQGNFGVIDSTGAAMMFEVGGSAYWRFDANNPAQSPHGYVLRTNFSVTGGGSLGIERYRRTVAQIREFQVGDTLDYRRIIRYHARDFSDFSSNPVPLPYLREWNPSAPLGYVYSNLSVCRYKSISAAVITGVRFGEPAALSTMWTILGQPASGIAVPYWPVGNPPSEACGEITSPLHDIATRIRSRLFDFPLNQDYIDSYKLRDECGNGLWAVTFAAEDSIFDAADRLLGRWRRDVPSTRGMLQIENSFATYAYSQLTSAFERLSRRTAFVVANSVPFKDENERPLENDDILQFIWAGANGRIDPPNTQIGSTEWGQPTGDDQLIGFPHSIGENTPSLEGMFRFQAIGWLDRAMGSPAAGDLVYLRAFNSSNLETATRYGDAQFYRVSMSEAHSYIPFIEEGQTTRPLKGVLAGEPASSQLSLSLNFPNPFNSSTSIEYEDPYTPDSRGPLELIIFNSLGQEVRTLVSGISSGGRRRLEWDGRDNAGQLQPSGVYYLRITAGRTTHIGRMVLLK
jgi:hypothetical protein